MLSGIQHFSFCRRQWALIHIEQQWDENLRTVEGNLFHKKAHDGYSSEKRKDTIISRGMPVFSRELSVSGICDIVEFKRNDAEGIALRGREGKYGQPGYRKGLYHRQGIQCQMGVGARY